MLKKYIMSLLFLCLTTLAFAKMTGTGYIITTQQDTVYGTMDVFFTELKPPKNKLHLKGTNMGKQTYSVLKVCLYEGSATKRKEEGATYLASQILYLFFTTKDGQGGSYLQKNVSLSKETVLLKPTYLGKINLYKFETTSWGGGGMMMGPPGTAPVMTGGGPTKSFYYVLETPTGWVEDIRQNNYRNILKRELKDCPDLVKKIGRSGFRYGNMLRIL